MDVRELTWFTTLAETEHVTEAAAALNIAQPTLSRAIARLERRLGTPLFDRTGHRLRLNQYGQVFRSHAVRALGELSAAEHRIATLIDPDGGTIALAFLHSFGTWLIPDLIRGYRERVPRANFVLRGDAQDTILADLRHGHVDVIVTSPRPDGEDVAWSPVAEERLCAAVPRGHPLARRRRVSLGELGGEDFVALRPEFGLRQITDRLCRHAGFVPRITFESTELATIQGLVAAGLGAAIMPRPRGGLGEDAPVFLRLSDEGAHRTVGVAVLAGRHQAPAIARFHEYVRDHASDA
ncbi:LysR family transcriptional regulator [Amycolatopsis nigrescens]|uniref:LysR family transcriptional regulator n=1 Tax=Amycolatopsis nigrescens TaxID=381445 RepID=UPI00035FD476|nr:LysR family transcriptional regulator [Amycolatopsis nigrescens]